MKILLVGNGNMGKIIQSIAKEQIVKVVENFRYNTVENNIGVDVIIDFSHRENIKYIYEYAKENKCKVVIATTNLNSEDYKLINELSEITPVMLDANYSYGIVLLNKIINDNIEYLKNYDKTLIEKHHKYKKDAPSGTSKTIQNIFKNNNSGLNIVSIRGGTVRGEHTLSFYGDEEILEIKHTAQSRKIYALGALEAAKWLMCKEKGLFSYKDCIFNE